MDSVNPSTPVNIPDQTVPLAPKQKKYGLFTVFGIISFIILIFIIIIFSSQRFKPTKPQIISIITPSISDTPIPTPSVDATTGWITYENKNNGYYFRYPPYFTLQEKSEGCGPVFWYPNSGKIWLTVCGPYINPDDTPEDLARRSIGGNKQYFVTRSDITIDGHDGLMQELKPEDTQINLEAYIGKVESTKPNADGTKKQKGTLGIYFYIKDDTKSQEARILFDQILLSFKFGSRNIIDDTADWINLSNVNGYTIKYPAKLLAASEQFRDIAPSDADGISIQQKVEGYNKPLLKIFVLKNNDFSSIADIAGNNFKENIRNKDVYVRIVENLHPSVFMGEASYEYKMESKGFIGGWTEFLGEQGIYRIIVFSHDDKYYLIGLYDNPLFTKILSTFRFEI